MNIIALIPARAHSKRVPHKNTRLLAGKPLIAHTIDAAKESHLFARIWVCSDDDWLFDWVLRSTDQSVSYRARPPVSDMQPDIEWVTDALMTDAAAAERFPEVCMILRPTSPFRTAETIRRAWSQFRQAEVHSLRAVQPVTEHPGKMWTWDGVGMPMKPLLDRKREDGTPWHSSPTQTLPMVLRQNASLEIVWSYVIRDMHSISGTKVLPFFTEGYEGFDINTEDDWREAERITALYAQEAAHQS